MYYVRLCVLLFVLFAIVLAFSGCLSIIPDTDEPLFSNDSGSGGSYTNRPPSHEQMKAHGPSNNNAPVATRRVKADISRLKLGGYIGWRLIGGSERNLKK